MCIEVIWFLCDLRSKSYGETTECDNCLAGISCSNTEVGSLYCMIRKLLEKEMGRRWFIHFLNLFYW